jgi:hypothetical protein
MTYSADQVWGLAVRADTLNDGYCKISIHTETEDKIANKILLKKWLIENIEATPEEVEAGQDYRKHFNCYLLTMLKRSLSGFEKMVVKTCNINEFTGSDTTEISIVSCLPKIAREERISINLNRELLYTSPISGDRGDKVGGTLNVTKSEWVEFYGKYAVGGWVDSHYVTFFTKEKYQADEKVVITGKIKKHQANNMSRLNYVKRKD